MADFNATGWGKIQPLVTYLGFQIDLCQIRYRSTLSLDTVDRLVSHWRNSLSKEQRACSWVHITGTHTKTIVKAVAGSQELRKLQRLLMVELRLKQADDLISEAENIRNNRWDNPPTNDELPF